MRTYIRKEASLSQTLQELAMLTVAREMNCAFIWYAHAAAARQAGVRDDIVDHIREKQALTGLAPEEQTVVNFTRELLQTRKVGKATFEAADRPVRSARDHDLDQPHRLLRRARLQYEYV